MKEYRFLKLIRQLLYSPMITKKICQLGNDKYMTG